MAAKKFIYTDNYQEEVVKAGIVPSINSEHSAIIIHFNSINQQHHGPSYWKFNASLLDDTDYLEMIWNSVPNWLNKFEDVSDKRVLWDLIKYRVRQVSLKYAKEKLTKEEKKCQTLKYRLGNVKKNVI